MQEGNFIYEITKQIQDKNNIKNDINSAFELISNMFKEKYTDKIMLEFNKTLENIENNPTKEINLLKAIKPFFKDTANIENTINTLKNFTAILSLKDNFYKKNNNNKEDDIIYINSIKKVIIKIALLKKMEFMI